MLLINKSLNHKFMDDKARRGISFNRQDGLCIYVTMCVWRGRSEDEAQGTSGRFKTSERLDLQLLALKMERAMS